MLAKAEEICVWKELREDIMTFLGVIYDRRDSTRTIPWESTPAFDKVERLMSEVIDYVDGHLQELDENYCESKTIGLYRKYAVIARENGINFVPFQGSRLNELPDEFEYIKAKGLATMDYEQTCKARRQYSHEVILKC